jgi:hypothetical protein
MRHLNKLLCACSFVALGLPVLTGCEGGELFDVNAPDWISDKVQEIEDSENNNQEDIYTFGSTDYSSAFWTEFSKYYVVPDGKIWTAEFELHIDPNATNTYKNFALVMTNDVDREGEGYKEYGVIRYDNQPFSNNNGNSEWGAYINRSYVQSTLTFETDTDEGIEKLGGKVTLTVDRTVEDFFAVTMTNGVVTKTYEQPYEWENLNAEASNTNIRCFLVVEGYYIDFLSSKIGTTGGNVSADKNPKSMVLQNVPDEVNVGADLKEAMADVTALVTFEEEVTKTVKASELNFSAIPDMDTPGEKTLVATYNKTFRGENCDTPIMAYANLKVVEKIVSIEVTTQPTRTTYYYYTSKATEGLDGRTLAFDPTGMVVTATEASGMQRVIDNSRLTFSPVLAKTGPQSVTITVGENVTATVNVNVVASTPELVSQTGNKTVGDPSNNMGFLSVFSDWWQVEPGKTKQIIFTNYTDKAANWNNYIVVLRGADKSKESEYAWLRADTYGKRDKDGRDTNNGLCSLIGRSPIIGNDAEWVVWRNWLDNKSVTVYVTNCGNGTADVQVVEGIGDDVAYQYYLGVPVNSDDLYFAISGDHCHLTF